MEAAGHDTREIMVPYRLCFRCWLFSCVGLHVFMFDWSALMIPQKATLEDSLRKLSEFVFYRHLAAKFQHSLFAVTLGIYVSG